MEKAEKLTYKGIINFIINKLNTTGEELSQKLDVDKATISNIKNGKQHYIRAVDAKVLFDEVFKEHINDINIVDALYEYICDSYCKESGIDKAYNEIKSVSKKANEYEKFYKQYVITILDIAYGNGKEMQALTNSKSKKDISNNSSLIHETEMPRIKFVPFDNKFNGYFFGRTETLSSIRERLISNKLAIVCGIGGLGKSYVADKYAEQFSNEYSQIQKVVFAADIKSTVLNIQFEGLDETHFTVEDRIKKRFSILKSFGSDTLLIIDNMDMHPGDKENFDLLKKMNMHILITSREMDIDSPAFNIPISPLNENEQLELFKKHYGYDKLPEEEINDYLKLFDLVEGHTLLIEMIAKTMSESDLYPVEMIECLTKGEYDSVSNISIEKDQNFRQDKMDNFVSNLFTTSKLTNAEQEKLLSLSLSSVNGIRRKLFKELTNSPDTTLINNLINKSWIVKEMGNRPDQLKIHLHPVIRTAVIENTEPSFEKCFSYLSNVINTYQFKQLSEPDKLDLLNIMYNAGIMLNYDESSLDVLSTFASSLFESIQYRNSMELYDKAVSVSKKTDELKDVRLVFKLYTGRGDNAVRLADYEKAIASYEHIAELLEQSNINEPEMLAKTYKNIASVFRKSSKYKEALDYYTKAKNTIDVSKLHNDRLYADVINDMGVVYLNLDRLDQAQEKYEKALKIRESFTERDAKSLAFSYHNIGTVYQRRKEYANAIKYHQKGLEIRKESCNPNDPIIAASLVQIGNDYTDAAKNNPTDFSFAEAEEYFKEGLRRRLIALGETHPDTAWTYFSIGKWYYYQEEYNEAINEFYKCLTIRRTALGENHAYTGESREWIGYTNYYLGKKEEALKELSKAKVIFESKNKVDSVKRIEKFISSKNF